MARINKINKIRKIELTSIKKEFNMDQRPIGMFDSGVGGLTVLKEIRRKIPNEKIIYFL